MNTRNAMPVASTPLRSRRLASLSAWIDGAAPAAAVDPAELDRIDWLRAIPFVALHLACLAVFWVGVSTTAVAVMAALFLVRMFFVTAFYHRYFSHRAFRTSRAFQFLMAVAGCTSGQRGPLWWAGHHRRHHATADTPADVHSPRQQGFLFSHTGWFLTPRSFATPRRYLKDWEGAPELAFLDRFDWLPLVGLAASVYALGAFLESAAPGLGVTGAQLFVWGFVVSTVLLYHATYTINSLAHRFGSQRFATGDDSRNNFLLALLTLGEGWHNNHHRYPASERQGFFWWELDVTHYMLVVMSWLGLVSGLKSPPEEVLKEAAFYDQLEASLNPEDLAALGLKEAVAAGIGKEK